MFVILFSIQASIYLDRRQLYSNKELHCKGEKVLNGVTLPTGGGVVTAGKQKDEAIGKRLSDS